MLAQIATRFAAIGGRRIEPLRTRRARVPPSAYRSTLGSYTSQRPVEPTPWREQNERIAPSPKP